VVLVRVRAAVTEILSPSVAASYAPSARRLAGVAAVALFAAGPAARAQTSPRSVRVDTSADSSIARQSPPRSPHYWTYLGLGAATSLALHEAGHVMTSIALGAHPTFGFNDGRPTIYSGIIGDVDHHDQFLFSAAGLTVQTVLDEAILDIPHSRGSAFERGVLAGGLGTTIFYLTIGRTGSVSDIELMAAMHGMTKTQSTLLFGGISALQIVRMHRDGHYANFFARPGRDGRYDVGLEVKSN
jgi:hypothetical protein